MGFLIYETVSRIFRMRVALFLISVRQAERTDTLSVSDTVELAARFLDDYLNGDKYFKCNYPAHNLVRTRCQLQLAKDIMRKKDELLWIVRDVMER